MLKSSLALLVLAPCIVGQVPWRHLLVSEDTNRVVRSGLSIVDPVSGVVTPLRPEGNGTFQMSGASITLDPANPENLYTAGLPVFTSRPSHGHLSLQGSRHRNVGNILLGGFGGTVQRMWMQGTDMLGTVTGQTEGLYRWTLASSASSLLVPLADARDVTVIAGRAYVNSFRIGQPSTVVEVDLASNGQVVFGTTYPTLECLTSLGNVLVGGTSDGRLLFLTQGNFTVLADVGRGPIIAAVADPAGSQFWFATTSEVVHFPSLAVVASFAGTIKDLEVGASLQASLVTAGDGCPGSNQQVPHHVWAGRPVLGNQAWSMQLAGGSANAPALLVLGSSRSSFGSLALPIALGPIGMPGCSLFTDMLVSQGLVLGGAGTGGVSLPVPNQIGLHGGRLTGQFLVFDPGANALGLVASDVAEGLIY